MIAWSRMFAGAAVALTLAPSACTVGPRADLDSPLPEERARALRDPELLDDPSTIPDRIRLLASDDVLERMLAIATLERMTGQTLGYDAQASEEDRRAAVSEWVAWYRKQQAGSQPPDQHTPEER